MEKREEYQKDIDIYRLAHELIVDDIVHPDRLREELILRFEAYSSKQKSSVSGSTRFIRSNQSFDPDGF